MATERKKGKFKFITDTELVSKYKIHLSTIIASQENSRKDDSNDEIVEIEEPQEKDTLKLPAIREFNQQFMLSNTPKFLELYPGGASNYMKECDSSRLPPRLNGVTNSVGNVKDLNIKYVHYYSCFSIGDRYAAAMSKTMRYLSPTFIHMKSNRLTCRGVGSILLNLCSTIKVINLSFNNIGGEGTTKIYDYLKTNSDSLQSIDLESCHLGDSNTIKICTALKKQTALNTVILDRNSITNNSCDAIKKMIKGVYTIRVVSLYWNSIQYVTY